MVRTMCSRMRGRGNVELVHIVRHMRSFGITFVTPQDDTGGVNRTQGVSFDADVSARDESLTTGICTAVGIVQGGSFSGAHSASLRMGNNVSPSWCKMFGME